MAEAKAKGGGGKKRTSMGWVSGPGVRLTFAVSRDSLRVNVSFLWKVWEYWWPSQYAAHHFPSFCGMGTSHQRAGICL